MGRENAISFGKSQKMKDSESLSNNQIYGFLGTWPDLKVTKPQSLSKNRGEAASRENLNKYYKELHTVQTKSS